MAALHRKTVLQQYLFHQIFNEGIRVSGQSLGVSNSRVVGGWVAMQPFGAGHGEDWWLPF
jgi:hypothetical protein